MRLRSVLQIHIVFFCVWYCLRCLSITATSSARTLPTAVHSVVGRGLALAAVISYRENVEKRNTPPPSRFASRQRGRRRSFVMLCLRRYSQLGPWLLRKQQVLTVSATRVNEVQEFVVTFTGDSTNDTGTAMMSNVTNAVIDLEFDSGNMNWACNDTTETASSVRILEYLKHNEVRQTCNTVFTKTLRWVALLLTLLPRMAESVVVFGLLQNLTWHLTERGRWQHLSPLALTRLSVSALRRLSRLLSQINSFTDGGPMKTALEGLSNIDGVTVTLDAPVFDFNVNDVVGVTTAESTLELRYQITFTGDCVRGNIPDAALQPSCTLGNTTAAVDRILCRLAATALIAGGQQDCFVIRILLVTYGS